MVRFLSALTLVFALGQANALPLDITNIVGGWQNANVVPPFANTITNVLDQGTDRFNWGTGQQSEYNFAPGADIIGVSVGTAFQLGTFNFLNTPVQFPTLQSIDYSFSFDTNGSPASLAGLLSFSHTETADDVGSIARCASRVLAQSLTQCDDFIDVSFAPLSQLFTVGADSFTFDLLGFSIDGGTTINNTFQTPEFGSTNAGLYAIIADANTGGGTTPVPEPGTLALFGLGILFTGLLRRKQRL